MQCPGNGTLNETDASDGTQEKNPLTDSDIRTDSYDWNKTIWLVCMCNME